MSSSAQAAATPYVARASFFVSYVASFPDLACSSAAASSQRVAAPSSSSQWVAPTSESAPTSQWVAPTSKWVAPASSTSQWTAPESSARVQASTSSSSYSGRATFYTQGGNPGSCGVYNSGTCSSKPQDDERELTEAFFADSAVIVAMNSPQVSGGDHCGKYVLVKNTANGQTVRAQVQDGASSFHLAARSTFADSAPPFSECPGCAYGSLDLSLGAYDQVRSPFLPPVAPSLTPLRRSELATPESSPSPGPGPKRAPPPSSPRVVHNPQLPHIQQSHLRTLDSLPPSLPPHVALALLGVSSTFLTTP